VIQQFLAERASTPSRLLGEPAPDAAQLARILEGALRVPDHARLTPWRFLLIDAADGAVLGERLAALLQQRDPAASAAAIDKERGRFTRAPLTVVLVSSPTLGHKVPLVEQTLSAGCVGMMLLLLAQAEGFGAQWLTGWPAYDSQVQQWLGLAGHEQVSGFFYIGTPRAEAPARPHTSLSGRFARWTA
jgi:nitroreductase